VLERFLPGWRELSLHESSPDGQLSAFLKKNCPRYSSSHHFANVPRGEYKGEHRSEDLSQMTFPDGSFDMFITSDVFEHVMDPAAAFEEIARVLKPGGAHVFTMPWYPQLAQTRQRARIAPGGNIEHLTEPDYHGNPIDASGSLVTFDWGLDFPTFIRKHGGHDTTVYVERNRSKGIDGEFLEVFITRSSG
jgi:SAM-dependent methyltransferase